MERSKNVSPALAAWIANGNRLPGRPAAAARPNGGQAGAAPADAWSTDRLNMDEKTAQRLNKFNIREENPANSTTSSATPRLNANVESPTFDQLVERRSATFAALADPTRYVMLIMLRQGEHSIAALARPHAMSFAAAAKHVKVLERAGLIERRRVGRQQICSLRAAPLRDAHQALGRWEGCWGGVCYGS